ncbi:unnamed protein product, partial [Meganyctiphanes norvegica]
MDLSVEAPFNMELVVFQAQINQKERGFDLQCNIILIHSDLRALMYRLGLWIKQSEYREQPNVLFKHELLLLLETSDGVLAWSTKPSFNLLMEKKLRVPFIKSRENDDNYDGIKDDLDFSISIPLQNTEDVHSITVITTFDYRLHRHCKLILEGAVLIQHNSVMPLAALHVMGDLSLHQRWPLPNSGRHSIYNTSVLPYDNEPENWRINSILEKYWQRNPAKKGQQNFILHQNSVSEMNKFIINIRGRSSEKVSIYWDVFWLI